MGINGKQKGNSAERAVANEFTFRFNDHFQRVPQSGAICGGLNRKKVENLRADAQELLSGDIICPPWFGFLIESKCYGEKTGPQMYSILEGSDRVLDKWLAQARGDATFAKKEFLILFKITRKASYIVVDYDKFIDLKIKYPLIMPPLVSFIKYKDTIIFDKNDFLDNYIVYYFPEDRKNIKKTIDINNKKEVISNEPSNLST